ncbi:LPXTG cell wall anchor domain-containing protein [Kitasatospora sp. MBT63]|uniref:LPXTG cell wall anchor domain-containing protein n=1 Tax=Kitasatospora sp. MBT63 TaxID=1444768 RepID=UPI00053B2FD6|nr:LPXTG cell wall anchor domain-containing protein [Kitasatospora sp. MBT63]
MRRISAVTAALTLATATALGSGAPAAALDPGGAARSAARPSARHEPGAATPAPRLTVTDVPPTVAAGGSARFSAELQNPTDTDLLFYPALRSAPDQQGTPADRMTLRYRPGGDDPVLVPAGTTRTLDLELALPPDLADGTLDFTPVAYWTPAGSDGGRDAATRHLITGGPKSLCVGHPTPGPSSSADGSPSASPRPTSSPTATPTGPTPSASGPSASASPSGAAPSTEQPGSRPTDTVSLASTGGGASPVLISVGIAFLLAGAASLTALRRRRDAGRHRS